MLRLPAILLWFCAALIAAPPTILTETGEIHGAKFTLARTRLWNQRVLFLAHGYRPDDRPLVADLNPQHLAYRTLLEEGWMIAMTSYRRNGIIVADAIDDLDALRAYIAGRFGPPKRVLIEGESMGGLVATLIAERDSAEKDPPSLPYSGVVAIGAALDLHENGAAISTSLVPRIPLLFLSNRSEVAAPRAYVSTKQVRRNQPELDPVLFTVSRDGHVNVNQRERLAAIRALNLWLDQGREAVPKPPPGVAYFDVTVPPDAQPSQVNFHPDGRGFESRVTEVSALYGNLTINAQPADFATLGVAKLHYLQLIVRGQVFRVRFGSDFSSVRRGEWVTFPDADGFMWLARNFGDAAATAKLSAGDTITLRRYDDPN